MTRTGLTFDDRYRLDERIAAGSVGQVWRATDLLLKRPVAVKVLRPEYADHPETLARFRKEAEHAGALNHPCIARVYDYGHVGPGGPPYLVMELVDGSSLADLLAVGPLEPALALDVIAQAAHGLHAAHQADLVHRDIKPGNILIAADGRVKITDFGIAYAAGQAPVTGPGLVMGTTLYMAPERISGGPGTPASDLYALGIVLHECLTGLPPYEGSAAEVMASHLYLPLPPLPASAPPELDALAARLTAKDPARRLRDASELAALAAAIRDAVRAAPSASAHPSASPPSAPPVPGEAGHDLPLGEPREPAFPGSVFPTGPVSARESASEVPGGHPGGHPGNPPSGYPGSGPGSGQAGDWSGPAGRGHAASEPGGRHSGTRPGGRHSGTAPPRTTSLSTRTARPTGDGRAATRLRARRRQHRRQAARLAVGAALLAGVGLTGLLISGALQAAPTVGRSSGSAQSTVAPALAVVPSSTAGPAVGGAGGSSVPTPSGAPGVTRTTGRRSGPADGLMPPGSPDPS